MKCNVILPLIGRAIPPAKGVLPKHMLVTGKPLRN